MADTHRQSDPEAQSPESDRDPRAGMPRWVKVSLIVGLALVLLFVIANLAGVGGEHGPGRHVGGGGTPPTVVDGGHAPVDHGP